MCKFTGCPYVVVLREATEWIQLRTINETTIERVGLYGWPLVVLACYNPFDHIELKGD